MSNNPFDTDRFFKNACLFEASLVLVAVVIGWVADLNPFASLHYSETAVFYGLVGTAPLYLLFMLFQQVQVEPVAKIRQMLLQTLAPGLARCSWADLCLLAAIAGISEEVLFRGVLQPWMESAWGMRAGLIGSNLLFGLVHAITPLYALLAALVGIYLALSMDFSGERNLLTPILIHGLYDFLAFLAIARSFRQMQT
jgi:uncharacterized protein